MALVSRRAGLHGWSSYARTAAVAGSSKLFSEGSRRCKVTTPEQNTTCWGVRQRQSFGANVVDYPDPNTCMGGVAKHFPGALPGQVVDLVTQQALLSYGFNGENTLLAHSTCPDEINANNTSDDLVVLLRRRWKGAFPLGGLAGLPFVGETGWGAFAAHVPEDGKIFLLFAPHVGVSSTGQVGYVSRRGQHGDSSACGAALAALGACNAGHEIRDDPYDYQQSYITRRVKERMDEINASDCPNATLTHVLFDVQVDFLRKMVRAARKNEKVLHQIAVLGGIQINTPDPEPDLFLPLMFEVHTPTGPNAREDPEDWDITDLLGSLTELLPGDFNHKGNEHL
eukprot:TRINITY_DN3824_c0_g1_i1.p1 TRINITY_DN3824_c0_g1~~TRINITY_DN3824_c0_g1_i1.p1  ORF type:complete len:369 (-),score=62.48 TRINITY_DN3824_c0_g1_i1:202-1221(-)